MPDGRIRRLHRRQFQYPFCQRRRLREQHRGGGAISVNNSNVFLERTRFVRNEAAVQGGAIQAWFSELTIEQSEFEAYLKLAEKGRLKVESRRQFFAYCSLVMRSASPNAPCGATGKRPSC